MAHVRIHIANSAIRHKFLILLASALSFSSLPNIFCTTLPDGFAESQYANGLMNPTVMAFAPDPCLASGKPVHRLFVCEQAGTVRVFRNGVLQPAPFLSVAADTRDERGLDGICFDPNFAVNHYVYVYYTILQSDPSLPTHNRLSRFTADPAHPDVALPGSELPLWKLMSWPPTLSSTTVAPCISVPMASFMSRLATMVLESIHSRTTRFSVKCCELIQIRKTQME